MRTLRYMICIVLLLTSTSILATEKLWTLHGVRFLDNGMASGSFKYDAEQGQCSNVDIRVNGPVFYNRAYTFKSGVDKVSCNKNYIDVCQGSCPGGSKYFRLTFDQPLSSPSAHIAIKQGSPKDGSYYGLGLFSGASGLKAGSIDYLSNAQQLSDCQFNAPNNWWQKTIADLPASVADNAVTLTPEFCEFYQFSQDWFLYLVSPSSASEGAVAQLQNQTNYPLLETKGTDSCDATFPRNALNVRAVKSPDDSAPFVIPERIDQAGANAIYDVNGNVVFYEIRFSRNLCQTEKILANSNFPGKTVELKTAWKVIDEEEMEGGTFYIMRAEIGGTEYNLGLVGLHIAVAADNHPEFVWITLDHKDNAIGCSKIGDTNNPSQWSFTRQMCAQDKNMCENLNQTVTEKAVTDICQVYPYGTEPSTNIDTNDGLNIALLEKLNSYLTGAHSVFDMPGVPGNLRVWKNYTMTGALWISNIEESSNVESNQRGSLELANTVMETSFQGPSGGLNCFGCHHYYSDESNTKKSATSQFKGLSHIFDDITSANKGGSSK